MKAMSESCANRDVFTDLGQFDGAVGNPNKLG